jgi:riboflavin synthase alpha subunit
MFTGLIQSVCQVRSAAKAADGMRLDIELGQLANQVKTGDSIA